MAKDKETEALLVFPSQLGWMALKMRGCLVRRLTFGHRSASAARKAIGPVGHAICRRPDPWQQEVIKRLQRFAAGETVHFDDIEVDLGESTEFQARVLKACRIISYGHTTTYGGLAAAACSPRAARAVGNCMAGNRVPLIVPCHRVVRACGDIGPYSAAEGAMTKRRLLDMEARTSQK